MIGQKGKRMKFNFSKNLFVVASLVVFVFPMSASAQSDSRVNLSGMNNAADASNESAKEQKKIEMAAYVTAAVLMTQCNPPHRVSPCVLAGLAALQGQSLGETGQDAMRSRADYSSKPLIGNGSGIAPTKGTGSGAGIGSSNFNAIQSQLAQKGMKLSRDGKTITLPDGSTVPTTIGNSDQAMSDAGLSAEDISSGRDALKDAQKQALDKIKGVAMSGDDSGGGGGGGGGRNPSADGSGGFNFNMKIPGAAAEKKPVNLSGMTKNFGGDKIGVAGDDIFQMITRRYKARDQGNSFFKH